ncbi:DUF2325 domain-containing protein [Desulfurivibrio alkaliphilus]|uniref:DUF2325 domain-containing protein n=1 Tax=Desulfurivibrio alkaliphilus (strain DSM 19089 / UNIQEM U267 / AHT2) TaxID=589865 RepID=D6Z071_DESAT|nr:DUF2325 domain-containing protein [Desulfurivibrio alkaliphilus]ADH87104.1 hypothetical protein DaAHT2_2439 [Desulfurivibrio alkaliphilus AHT 2]
MSIAIIGGMKRLESRYREEGRRRGFDLKVFNVAGRDLERKLLKMAAVVLFTDRISHNARREVVRAARLHRIPLYQYHSCGLCTLRDCLDCLSAPSDGKDTGQCGCGRDCANCDEKGKGKGAKGGRPAGAGLAH